MEVLIHPPLCPYMMKNYPKAMYEEFDPNMFYFFVNSDDYYNTWVQNKNINLDFIFQ